MTFPAPLSAGPTRPANAGAGIGVAALTLIPQATLPTGVDVGTLAAPTSDGLLRRWDGTEWILVGGGGSGTVTSVSLSVPAFMTESGSPVTGSGTLGFTFNVVPAGEFLGGPATGSPATPSFRALIASDIPALPASQITSGQLALTHGGTGLDGSAAADGTLLIGTGSGFALATLSNGPGITIGVGSGSIQVNGVPFSGASSDANGAQGDVVAPTAGQQGLFLRGDGTWAAVPAAGVSSVGLSVPAFMTASGTPITGAGTLSFSFNAVAAHAVFAGPASGSAAAPGFRALTPTDIPALPTSQITSGQFSPARGGTGVDGSAAADGTLLIGTGSGFAIASLANGAGISVAVGAGTLEVSGVVMTGASSGAAGTQGDVAAPTAGQEGLFWRGDGTWAAPSSASGTVTGGTSVAGIAVFDAATSSSSTLAFKGLAEGSNITISDDGMGTLTIAASGGGGGAVASVNTRTGAVVLEGTDIPVFGASGGSHAPGAVPDPGASSGSTRFVCENATFVVPPTFLGDTGTASTDQVTPNLANNTTADNLTSATGTRPTDAYLATNTSYVPNNPSTGWGGQNTGVAQIQWVIDLQRLVTATGYTLKGHIHFGTDLSPTEWTFEGSTDGTSYTTLDHPVSASTEEILYTGTVASPGPYRYYRFTFYAGALGVTSYNLIMSDFQILGYNGTGGTAPGYVPYPLSGDAAAGKVLGAGGSWVVAMAASNEGSGVTVYDSTASSVSTMVFKSLKHGSGITITDDMAGNLTIAAAVGVSSVNTRTGAVVLLGTDIPAFVGDGELTLFSDCVIFIPGNDSTSAPADFGTGGAFVGTNLSTSIPGPFNNGLQFGGGSSLVSSGNAIPALGTGSSWTIAFWIKTTNTSLACVLDCGGFGVAAGQIYVFTNAAVSGDIGFNGVNPGGGFVVGSGVNGFTSGSPAINDGAWHFIVCEKTPTAFTIEIDNTVANTTSITDFPVSHQVATWGNDWSGQNLTGSMAEMQFYSRALTGGEKTQLFTEGFNSFGGITPGGVPAPALGDAAAGKVLGAGGTWVTLGNVAVAANVIAYGDGLTPGGVTGDPNITYVGNGLQLNNTYSLYFVTGGGWSASLGVDSGDSLNLYGTDSAGNPLLLFTTLMDDDTPTFTFEVPVIVHSVLSITGGASYLLLPDQDGRDPGYRLYTSGSLQIYSEQASAVVGSLDYQGTLTVAQVTATAGSTSNLQLTATSGNIIVSTPALIPHADATTDIGSGLRFANGFFSGVVEADSGLLTPVLTLEEQDLSGLSDVSPTMAAGAVVTVASANGACTFEPPTDMVNGQTMVVYFTQPASGGNATYTFSGIIFPYGISPDVTQIPSAIDVLTLTMVDGAIYGELVPVTISPFAANALVWTDGNGLPTTTQSSYTFTTPIAFTDGVSSQRNGVTDSEFFGAGAGNAGYTGGECVGVGVNALNAITNGFSNVGLGHLACASVTSGFANLGIGTQALKLVVGSNYNIGIGAYAGQNQTGGSSIFIGSTAGQNSTGVNGCVFIGQAAGIGVLTASNNVFIGNAVGGTVDHAGANIVIGQGAATNSLGVSNVVIGDGAVPSAAVVNSISIGAGAGATGSGGIGIGRAAAPAVGQFIVGTVVNGNQITDFYPNSASTIESNIQSFTFHGMNSSGANAAGGQLTFSAGTSTGTGLGGSLVFQTSPAGSSGSGVNAAQNRLIIDTTGTSTFLGPVVVDSNVIEEVGVFASFLQAESGATNGFRWTLNNDGSYRLQTSANAFLTSVTATPIWMTTAGRVVFGAVVDNGVDQVQVSGSVYVSSYLASAGLRPGLVSKTGAYLATTTDHTIICDTSGGAFSVTLPASPGLDQVVTIKLINSTNMLTVAGNGKTIDGNASITSTVQNYAWTMQYDGTQWWLI